MAGPAADPEPFAGAGPMSADEAVKVRAPLGVSEHAMTGAWRVIVARRPDQARSFYYDCNDDPRLLNALRWVAQEWIEAA